MKFTELKNDIKEGARRIYLLEGDDAYFRMKAEEMIKSAFMQLPELNFTVFDGEALKGGSLSALVAAVESFPFMSEKRIVKISEFHPSESDYEGYLKKTFENFPADSILLIVNAESKKGVDLKRKQCVAFVDCSRSEEESVVKWVYLTLKKAGISASVDVCAAVARYCLCNMSRVALETEKLIDYKGCGELTRAEVDELVFKDAEYRMYEMTNAVARRDYSKFLSIQSELCRKNGDEASLLSGLFSYFKNLLTVISSGLGDKELASLLKMKEYGVKKSREQADSLGQEKLEKYVKEIYASVSDLKCGNITPQSALQRVNAKIFFE